MLVIALSYSKEKTQREAGVLVDSFKSGHLITQRRWSLKSKLYQIWGATYNKYATIYTIGVYAQTIFVLV